MEIGKQRPTKIVVAANNGMPGLISHTSLRASAGRGLSFVVLPFDIHISTLWIQQIQAPKTGQEKKPPREAIFLVIDQILLHLCNRLSEAIIWVLKSRL